MGELFNMGYAATSQVVKRFKSKIKKDDELLDIKNAIIKNLKCQILQPNPSNYPKKQNV